MTASSRPRTDRAPTAFIGTGPAPSASSVTGMQGSPATKEGGAPTVMPAESLAPTGVPARRVIQLCAESRLGQAWLQATDSNRKLAEQREIAVGGQEGLYAMCDA